MFAHSSFAACAYVGEGLVHEVHDLVPDSWTDPDRGNENSRNQLIYLVVSQYDIYGKGKNKLPLPYEQTTTSHEHSLSADQ